MGAEIALGEVGGGPGEELVEVGAVIVDQRKEHGVALALGGGAVASLRVDDAAVAADELGGVGLPEAGMVGWGGLGGGISREVREGRGSV